MTANCSARRVVGKFCQRYAFPIGIPMSLGHSHAHLLIVQQDGACRHLVPRYRGIEQQVAALGRAADAQIQIAVLGGKPREYLADTLRARQRTDAQTACAGSPQFRRVRRARLPVSSVRTAAGYLPARCGAIPFPFARITRLPARFPDSVWFWIQRAAPRSGSRRRASYFRIWLRRQTAEAGIIPSCSPPFYESTGKFPL